MDEQNFEDMVGVSSPILATLFSIVMLTLSIVNSSLDGSINGELPEHNGIWLVTLLLGTGIMWLIVKVMELEGDNP